MNFFNKYGRVILKHDLNKFVLSLFGLMLFFSTSSIDTLKVGASIFAVLFYLYLVYNVSYELGSSDGIVARREGTRVNYLNGLWIGLLSNVITLITVVLRCIFASYPAYSIGKFVYTVCDYICKICTLGMYDGLVLHYSPVNPIGFLLCALPGIFVCAAAYILGSKDFHFRTLIGIKFDEKKEREKNNY